MKHPWRLGYMGIDGRGSWIRTNGCRDQNPVPYHLAIPLMRQNFNIFTVKCQGKLTVLQQMSVLSFFEKMAGVAGFEPTDAEIKTRCLRSEEHTSELQSRENLVCRLLLEKKKKN